MTTSIRPSTDLVQANVAQFYYSSELGDLVIGQAENVVSNGVRVNLPVGTFVLNYARIGDKFYCQVGISTGVSDERSASDIWPNWGSDNPVFQVRWLTGQVSVPADYFTNQRMSLPKTDVLDVINYVLLNN